MTHWSTSTSDSVLQGGMTYSDGYITVPESGIYFIYFHLYTDVSSSSLNTEAPAIHVDSRRIGFSIYFRDDSVRKSHYVGLLWNVKKGSRLSVRTNLSGRVRYSFAYDQAFFGAWKVN